MVVDGPQGTPLGHQPCGAAIGSGGVADLYDRTANGVLQNVDGVIGGPRRAVPLWRLDAPLHGLVLLQAEHLGPEVTGLLDAPGSYAQMGNAH